MLHPKAITVSVLVLLNLSCLDAVSKNKKKAPLPADVLKARNVLVVVDPDAGVSPADPNANRIAREDVEKALIKWWRFDPVTDTVTADLIITVRKGDGKAAQGTVGNTPVNDTPPIAGQSTDSKTGAAVRWGRSGIPEDPSNTGSRSSGPTPQIEVGSSQDMFVVYRGNQSNPLNWPPVWRYSAKGALSSPNVPAVEVFRKLITDSEKQLAASP
jgi:hypothetical protein